MSATNRGGKRSPADFYPTPAWCVHRFLEALPLPGGVWYEPCAGSGSIISAVNEKRSDVTWWASELCEENEGFLKELLPTKQLKIGDVLTRPEPFPSKQFDVVFTNPPYRLAQEFIELGIRRAKYCCMLLRINYLASEKRASFMRRFTPDVYVLPNRPSFRGSGSDSTEYGWFVFSGMRKSGKLKILAHTPLASR